MSAAAWVVEVVHGDLETDDDAAAVRTLSERAWSLGCRRVHGTNDETHFVMPAQTPALALLAVADQLASSWWRVTVRGAAALA